MIADLEDLESEASKGYRFKNRKRQRELVYYL